MRSAWLGVVLSVLGCGSGSVAAVQPIRGQSGEDAVAVVGTVKHIEFQNINKAQGHFTYNVEVVVSHAGIAASPFGADHEPGTMRVRVHKVYWGRLGADEQRSIAPEGPQHMMHLDRWKDYVKGGAFNVDVVVWSPGLSAPAPR